MEQVESRREAPAGPRMQAWLVHEKTRGALITGSASPTPLSRQGSGVLPAGPSDIQSRRRGAARPGKDAPPGLQVMPRLVQGYPAAHTPSFNPFSSSWPALHLLLAYQFFFFFLLFCPLSGLILPPLAVLSFLLFI